MKIGSIRILTEKTYQNNVNKAIRLDQCRRDRIRSAMLDKSVAEYATLAIRHRNLQKRYSVLLRAVNRRSKN